MSEKYPEHAKMKAVLERSQAIGEFLDWLEDGGLPECGHVFLAYHPGDDGWPTSIPVSKQRLLARFFDIDMRKIDAEKEAMLEECRAVHREAANA